MKVFVSGATGVVGRRAVRLLAEAGHEVTAMARTDEKARLVEGLGATAVRVSLFDRPALERVIAGHDVVVNLATSIPSVARMASPKAWEANDRIRTEGSRILVDAALAAGARRYIQERGPANPHVARAPGPRGTGGRSMGAVRSPLLLHLVPGRRAVLGVGGRGVQRAPDP